MSLAYCIALLAAVAANESRDSIEFTKDALAVVKKNIADGKAILVDVRSQEEWNKGHIDGSIFVPVDSLRKNVDAKSLAKKLPQKKTLYTFCVVGMRAKAAAIKLQKLGYTVMPLKPGYDDLIKAGFPKGKEETAKRATNEDTRQRNAR
jgi:phage shock protein E